MNSIIYPVVTKSIFTALFENVAEDCEKLPVGSFDEFLNRTLELLIKCICVIPASYYFLDDNFFFFFFWAALADRQRAVRRPQLEEEIRKVAALDSVPRQDPPDQPHKHSD